MVTRSIPKYHCDESLLPKEISSRNPYLKARLKNGPFLNTVTKVKLNNSKFPAADSIHFTLQYFSKNDIMQKSFRKFHLPLHGHFQMMQDSQGKSRLRTHPTERKHRQHVEDTLTLPKSSA